ncbi:gamma-glutamyltransferase [Candidatus Zixiibacteriota bacterium]
MKRPPERFCSMHILLSLLILLTSVTVATSGCSSQVSGNYDQGMVVSADTLASRVGAAVLKAGGNAVDAAVATGFALAVTFPGAGNIGGGGFMVVRLPDGTSTAFDFREKAPLAAHARMFLDENGEYSSRIHHNSHLAVGVPGTVAGFALAHDRLGNLPWEELVEPAVKLAREGFTLTESRANDLARYVRGGFQPYPASMAAFSNDGEPYGAGERLVQSDLAATLERIMREGRDGFYRGETARLIAEEMVRGGGMITEEDLARYEAKERVPVKGTYRGYDIISMHPPSSGGPALIEMLNILEGYDLQEMGHNSTAYIHHLTEAMRRAYRDRARWLADMDFVDVPLERILSKEYAAELRQGIDPQRATPSSVSDVELPYESTETTHYSVVDAGGMAVSVTYTIEAWYGSKITVPGAGFLLNDEMGDFNAAPGMTTDRGLIGTDPNLARPEQRMLSSMTPSIVAKDGELVAVVGAPGGRTIINSVMEVIIHLIDFGMDIQSAVDAARFHHQWLPAQVRIERDGATAEVIEALRAMGHEVTIGGSQGRTNCIGIDPLTGKVIGAADTRQPDAAAIGSGG